MQIQLGQAATRVGAATSMEGRTEMHICCFWVRTANWNSYFTCISWEILHICECKSLESNPAEKSLGSSQSCHSVEFKRLRNLPQLSEPNCGRCSVLKLPCLQYCPERVVDKNIYHSVTKVQCHGSGNAGLVSPFCRCWLLANAQKGWISIAVAIVLHRLLWVGLWMSMIPVANHGQPLIVIGGHWWSLMITLRKIRVPVPEPMPTHPPATWQQPGGLSMFMFDYYPWAKLHEDLAILIGVSSKTNGL